MNSNHASRHDGFYGSSKMFKQETVVGVNPPGTCVVDDVQDEARFAQRCKSCTLLCGGDKTLQTCHITLSMSVFVSRAHAGIPILTFVYLDLWSRQVAFL